MNKPINNGTTPVFKSSEEGYREILNLLMSKDGTANTQTKHGATALFQSSQNGHAGLVAILLNSKEGKLTINKPWPMTGATPLYQAVWRNHIDAVRTFLTYNEIHVNIPDKNTSQNNHLANTKILLQHNETNVKKPSKAGFTPLDLAAQKGNIEIVKTLIASNATIDRPNGVTPLYFAIVYGHEATVRVLLNSGAELSNLKYSTLYHARNNGYSDVVNTILGQKYSIIIQGYNIRGEISFWYNSLFFTLKFN